MLLSAMTGIQSNERDSANKGWMAKNREHVVFSKGGQCQKIYIQRTYSAGPSLCAPRGKNRHSNNRKNSNKRKTENIHNITYTIEGHYTSDHVKLKLRGVPLKLIRLFEQNFPLTLIIYRLSGVLGLSLDRPQTGNLYMKHPLVFDYIAFNRTALASGQAI